LKRKGEVTTGNAYTRSSSRLGSGNVVKGPSEKGQSPHGRGGKRSRGKSVPLEWLGESEVRELVTFNKCQLVNLGKEMKDSGQDGREPGENGRLLSPGTKKKKFIPPRSGRKRGLNKG